ncbi:phage portal protein [Salmonella enterica]|nr:phage portal protein [Salmonella enterica]
MFFSGLFQRKSDAPVTTPAELADAIGLSYDTYTGKQISSQRAMRLTAVFSCVRVLAESVGMLPCNLYHLNGSLKQRATGERLHKLISTHPNGYMTPQEFWELVVTCLCLRGNFYAYKVKAFGEVAELLPVDPGSVVPKLNSSWEPVYQVTFPDGSTDVLSQEDIWHVRTLTLDGLVGLNPIAYAREAISLAAATAIVAGGWIIVARTRRRVRLRREPLPADTPVCGARAGWGVYVPGAVIALAVGAGSYALTGSYQQVRVWQQATAQTPGLLARALDPQAQPLNEEEMARLALGLRTRLQNDAGNVEGWLMLGRIGMVLGNAGTATGAYANAYRLDPKNRDAALGYAEALTRSSDPEDNRRGGELLRQLVSRDHTDIRVLSLYAFSAFEQQRFGEAVAAWEMMLKLLPAGDARRAVIERSIRLAQEK